MKTLSKARISAIGTYVPEKRMTNKEFEKIVDTSDEWIIQRTGMKERRIAGSRHPLGFFAALLSEVVLCRCSPAPEVPWLDGRP